MNEIIETEKEEGKWDEGAIDNTCEQLLDSIGQVLDQLMLSGCRVLFVRTPFLKYYLEILELIEGELLIQWKIRREKGLQALFVRQRYWMSNQLRAPDGFFSKWNMFCSEVWKVRGELSAMLNENPWKSLLLQTLTDLDCLPPIKGVIQGNKRQSALIRICDLFEKLYKNCPYHQAISFLNFIEIGARQRPDIQAIGQIDSALPSRPAPSVIQNTFTDLINHNNWEKIPEKLVTFWEKNSGGVFSLFPASLLKRESNGKCSLVGICPENLIRFDNLIGIENNREKLIQNTGIFLSGGFARHVLLWGGRGTGKSSSILALLADFVDQGLRLIEIQQRDLDLLPELSNQLKKRPEKFILFCDDLSFEKNSTDYKHLKSIMEGSVLAPAGNLLFMVTANRKDLVFRGELDERNPEQKQLIDEKRAIDDRFGLKLFYEVPVFKDLHKILFHYADESKRSYNKEDLVQRFHHFARLNNHDKPAGRTVQQFIRDWEQNHE